MFFMPYTDMIQYQYAIGVRPSAISEQSQVQLMAELAARLPLIPLAILPSADHHIVIGITVQHPGLSGSDPTSDALNRMEQIMFAAEAVYGQGRDYLDGPTLVGIAPA